MKRAHSREASKITTNHGKINELCLYICCLTMPKAVVCFVITVVLICTDWTKAILVKLPAVGTVGRYAVDVVVFWSTATSEAEVMTIWRCRHSIIIIINTIIFILMQNFGWIDLESCLNVDAVLFAAFQWVLFNIQLHSACLNLGPSQILTEWSREFELVCKWWMAIIAVICHRWEQKCCGKLFVECPSER